MKNSGAIPILEILQEKDLGVVLNYLFISRYKRNIWKEHHIKHFCSISKLENETRDQACTEYLVCRFCRNEPYLSFMFFTNLDVDSAIGWEK